MAHPLRITALALLGAAACSPRETPRADAAADSTASARVAVTEGFSTPESVLWDAEQDVWFVSNINGSPTAHDGNGFISRLTRDGAVAQLQFVQGGQGGVTLNGPKGMALVGDTLWVADIDAVRGFDRHTGKPLGSVELGDRAKFLNDVAVGPDGTLYVTDTGIAFDAQGQVSHPGPDRIFAIQGGKATVAAEGDWLGWPNGITWDLTAGRFVVVPFGGKTLLGWKPGATTADTIGTGPGSQDGVEFLGGKLLVTSWADSSVFSASAGGNQKVLTGLNSPADLGVDQVRGLAAVPLFLENRVEFWRVR